MSPRVLIFGAGSIGAIFSYLLSKVIPEENIVAICRSNYTEAKANGFTIDSTLWGNSLRVRPVVVRSVAEALAVSAHPFDFIIITTKVVSATPSPATLIEPAVGPDTSIVVSHNGIGIEDEYAKRFPENPILSIVLYTPVTQLAPALFSHSILKIMHVGTYPSSAPDHHKLAAEQFCKLMNSAGATAHHQQDIQVERWTKVLVNGCESPICALTRCRNAQFVCSSYGTAKLIQSAMRDIAAVARASGYAMIDETVVQRQLKLVVTRELPGIEPSMMADALAGRSMEVEAIVGNVIELGRKHRVETPTLRILYLLVNALNVSFATRNE